MLGLSEPWSVADAALDTKAKTLTIRVTSGGETSLPCPKCGKASPLYDLREERSWRHLDAMQFATTIVARVPRVDCAADGVSTVRVPWAEAGSRFTSLFERFAVDVLLATSSVTAACLVLGISWDQARLIQTRAVERGMARRKRRAVRHVGIDEKSFLKGHRYASLAVDLDDPRVLDVAEGRALEGAKALLEAAVPKGMRKRVEAGAMDMWQPFMDAWKVVFGGRAPIVHDKFHVSGYLGKAVDGVRRGEHRALKSGGDDSLARTKWMWLKNPGNWKDDERETFEALAAEGLKVGRAWAIKESFRKFWDYSSRAWAHKFFDRWYYWATHSRLKPVVEAARTLKRHLEGLLSYCEHRITNAATEGLNSKIQAVKAGARGFRTFANYRAAILFHCGGLNLYP
jgi:transposase